MIFGKQAGNYQFRVFAAKDNLVERIPGSGNRSLDL
jgi:hypothetical protein